MDFKWIAIIIIAGIIMGETKQMVKAIKKEPARYLELQETIDSLKVENFKLESQIEALKEACGGN